MLHNTKTHSKSCTFEVFLGSKAPATVCLYIILSTRMYTCLNLIYPYYYSRIWHELLGYLLLRYPMHGAT